MEPVAEGGQAEIFRGRHQDGSPVAIKVLRLDTEQAASRAARRLREEGRTLDALDHPGIPRLLGSGTLDAGAPYLILPWIEGCTLAELPPTVSRPALLGIFEDFLEAMSHAHERRVIHRDLKPDNLRVDGTGHGRVLDFGVGLALESGRTRFTRRGEFLGTGRYAAPEVVRRGAAIAGMASDVYSLGRILSEHAVRLAEPERRAAFDALVAHACAEDPRRRYRDAGQLLAAFRAWRSGASVPAPRRRARGLFAWATPRRAGAATVAALGLLVALGDGGGCAPGHSAAPVRLAPAEWSTTAQREWNARVQRLPGQVYANAGAVSPRSALPAAWDAYLNRLEQLERRVWLAAAGRPAAESLQADARALRQQLGEVPGDPLQSAASADILRFRMRLAELLAALHPAGPGADAASIRLGVTGLPVTTLSAITRDLSGIVERLAAVPETRACAQTLRQVQCTVVPGLARLRGAAYGAQLSAAELAAVERWIGNGSVERLPAGWSAWLAARAALEQLAERAASETGLAESPGLHGEILRLQDGTVLPLLLLEEWRRIQGAG